MNNGDRNGLIWNAGYVWYDGTTGVFPDWVQVTFNGQKSISEIDVFFMQDAYTAPVVPTTSMTFTKYGMKDFDVQYWNGTAWVTVTGGSIIGNNLIWRTITFPAVTTDRIRVVANKGVDGYTRVVEIEAYGN